MTKVGYENADPIPHTRLEYDFFPRGYVAKNYADFLNPNEAVLKGLVYAVHYLPRTRTWLAKGVIGPAAMHLQLPFVAERERESTVPHSSTCSSFS